MLIGRVKSFQIFQILRGKNNNKKIKMKMKKIFQMFIYFKQKMLKSKSAKTLLALEKKKLS